MSGRAARPLALLVQDAALLAGGVIGSPFFAWRALTRERWRRGLRQRFGLDVPDPPVGSEPLVWLHAASAGEMGAVVALLEVWRERGRRFVLSSTTTAGLTVAARRAPDVPRFLLPLDFGPVVRRVYDRLRPDLLVLVELELWPRLVAEAVRRGVGVAVANGRVGERTERRLRHAFLARHVGLYAVEAFAVQTDETRERLLRLGVRPEAVAKTGNVKADAGGPDEAHVSAACRRLGLPRSEKVVVAGSTHPGEEALVARALARAAQDGVLLVVAPRHRERLASAERNLQDSGLEPVRWSRLEDGAALAPGRVVVVDTMGDLPALYAAADAAVVGGSFVEGVGGHNVFEPVLAGAPAVVGPHHANVRGDVLALCEQGALRVAGGEDALAAIFSELLGPGGETARAAARRALEGCLGAARRTVGWIEERCAPGRVNDPERARSVSRNSKGTQDA